MLPSHALRQAGFLATIAVAGTMSAHAVAATDSVGQVSRYEGVMKGKTRDFLVYLPRTVKPHPPLLFFFHGSGGNAESSREVTGREFETMADRDGFLVVYPDGYENTWNDCRKDSPQPARLANIDDESFVETMIAKEVADHGADTKRVFAAGWSNGGQFSYRLAMERAGEFTGVAAISASLPTQENMACHPLGAPMPVMIINGTGDPINPYNGGMVTLGRATLGTVLSTEATARYFAELNGLGEMPTVESLPHLSPSDRTSVQRMSWTAPGKPSVVLYAIQRGGHLVPQPFYSFPEEQGRQTKDLDAPVAIWDFFSGLPSRQ